MENLKSHKKVYPKKSTDIPVTQSILYSVRDELKSEIKEMAQLSEVNLNDVKSEWQEADDNWRIELDELKIKLEKTYRRYDEFKAKLEASNQRWNKKYHEQKIIAEEQNARNIFVLDGLDSLFHRQERLEKEAEK